MTIEDFKINYVYNERRLQLFNTLIEVINYYKQHSTEFKFVIFGSFITDKELPCDIDILQDTVLNEKGKELVYLSKKFEFPTIVFTDMHFKGKCSMDKLVYNSPEERVISFNQEEDNILKSIKISNYLALDI